MNEETILASEETLDPTTEPTTEPVQTETAPTDDGLVTEPSSAPETIPATIPATVPETAATEESTAVTIYEDLSGVPYEETIAETTEPVMIVDVIESVGSDIAHASLFSGFLVCGTLIGLALLRKIYGT